MTPTNSRPISSRTLSRCQSVGRNRQIQASRIVTASTANRNQPANAGDVERCVLAEPERLDRLEVGGGQWRPVADDDLALGDVDLHGLDVLGSPVLGLIGKRLAER